MTLPLTTIPPTMGLSASAAVRSYVEHHRQELLAMLGQVETSGVVLAHRNAKIADGLLRTSFAAAVSAAPPAAPVLLAAVGAYGRMQLGLKSDLDVWLVSEDAPERTQALAESLLYPLWDAGLSVGHHVVTPDDAIAGAAQDLPTATALLDLRPLVDDGGMARGLRERAFAEVFGSEQLCEFMARLGREVEQRHRRFGDSVYLLEPDIKNGVGGLRDSDVAWWAARARFRGQGWRELLDVGVLTAQEARALHAATDFFWCVRNRLHRRAGRRSDRLTFEEQEQIARSLGYRERIAAPPGASDELAIGPMVECFMSDYYRHARAVTHARERILERATPQPGRPTQLERDLGQGICAVAERLGFTERASLVRDPALALRLYAFAVARGCEVLPAARDQVARAAADPGFCAALRADREARALFVSLLCTVRSTALRGGSVLAELHDVGLLLAMIPEFAPVVGRVHHDLYHVYTVDVHSVAAVDRLRALIRGDLVKEHPLASRLAAEVSRKEVLFFATLLHDVGKAISGRDHSRRGAEMAQGILERFELGADDIAQVRHLVLHHLSMYTVAVRRDLSEPATIVDFMRDVHDRELLRDLYLITIADISTTGPTSMTAWKSRVLDELFAATDAALSGTVTRDPGRLARIREQVRARCDGHLEPAFLHEFLHTMPARYLLSNTPAEIAAHAQVAFSARDEPIRVRLVPSRHPEVAELCIVTGAQVERSSDGAGVCVITHDRPGLLAAIAAAMTASRLEIHAAQVYSRQGPAGELQAVDVFWVRDRSDGIDGVADALPKLERDLRGVISGNVSARDLVRPRSSSRWSERPSPPVMTEVTIDNHTSFEHTIIEVVAKDRPGLLFTLADALHDAGLTIAIAKVNTEGNRVVDVFYVTEIQGGKLATLERSDAVRARLLGALSPVAVVQDGRPSP